MAGGGGTAAGGTAGAGASAGGGTAGAGASAGGGTAGAGASAAGGTSGSGGSTPNPGPRSIWFDGQFETGPPNYINDRDDQVDGYRFRTLPTNQKGNEIFACLDGKCDVGPTSGLDVRVVSGATPPTTNSGSAGAVTPREGSYMLEAQLKLSQNYTGLQADGLDKPRSTFTPGRFKNHILWGKQTYVGLCVYLPSNFESEKTNNRLMFFEVNTTAQFTNLAFGIQTPEAGAANWALIEHRDDSSIKDNQGALQVGYNLGPINPDKGRWTCFAFDILLNPFTTSTNASTVPGGRDQVYPGNAGRLVSYKQIGDYLDKDLNRAWKQVGAKRVNKPVGLVPIAPTSEHPGLTLGLRVYKPVWRTKASSAKGPIAVYMDSFYFGEAARDGTTLSDVTVDRTDPSQ